MRRIQITIPIIILTLIACATIADKGRMKKFVRLSEAYEFNLLDSNYRAAARFIDASVEKGPLDEKKLRNIKIVEYDITHMNVSDDRLEIEQEVKVQYFLLNINRLRTLRHHQVWRYNETKQVWLLHTDLPKFQ